LGNEATNSNMKLPGSELYRDYTLGFFERWYCRILGVPIIGLRIRLRRVAKLLPAHASAVLDAGCGRGVITRYLARRYSEARIDALDTELVVQEKNTQIAEKSRLENCNFIVADLQEYHCNNCYDLIVSVDNLEHVENDRAVLSNFYESMVENGRLLVHVPHYYRRWPVFAWQPNFDVPGHVRPGYHMAELREKVEQAGFEILKKGFSYGFMENLVNNISYAITRAEEKNRIIYALLFPVLNFMAWLGQWSNPGYGAGVWVIATKRKSPTKQKNGSTDDV